MVEYSLKKKKEYGWILQLRKLYQKKNVVKKMSEHLSWIICNNNGSC